MEIYNYLIIKQIIQIFMMILQIFNLIIRKHVPRLTCVDCKEVIKMTSHSLSNFTEILASARSCKQV